MGKKNKAGSWWKVGKLLGFDIYIYVYTHDIYLYIDGEISKFYVLLYTSFFLFSAVSNDAIFEAPLQARWAKKSKRKKKPKRDDRTEEQKVGKNPGKSAILHAGLMRWLGVQYEPTS